MTDYDLWSLCWRTLSWTLWEGDGTEREREIEIIMHRSVPFLSVKHPCSPQSRVQKSGDCRTPYKLSFISCCDPCQRATLHRIQRPQDYKNPSTTASHPKNNIHIHSGFYVLSSPVPVWALRVLAIALEQVLGWLKKSRWTLAYSQSKWHGSPERA